MFFFDFEPLLFGVCCVFLESVGPSSNILVSHIPTVCRYKRYCSQFVAPLNRWKYVKIVHQNCLSFWWFDIAMEHDRFRDDLPIKHCHVRSSLFHSFPRLDRSVLRERKRLTRYFTGIQPWWGFNGFNHDEIGIYDMHINNYIISCTFF